MARIDSLPNDETVSALDKFLITDAADNSSKNLTVETLAQFFASNGLADPSRLGFSFEKSDGDITSGTVRLLDANNDTATSFGAVTTIRFSNLTNRNVNTSTLARVILNATIKITDVSLASDVNHGYFNVQSVDTTQTTFTDADVLHITSVGAIPSGTTTITPTGGSAGRVTLNGEVGIVSGGGNPNGVVTADAGAFYIDTTANDIYGPKVGSDDQGWGTGTSIIGPTGSDGNPVSGVIQLGNDADGNAEIRFLVNGQQVDETIVVPRGPTGAQGAMGDQGIQGNAGEPVSTATGAIDPVTGDTDVVFGTVTDPDIGTVTVQRGIQGIQGGMGDPGTPSTVPGPEGNSVTIPASGIVPGDDMTDTVFDVQIVDFNGDPVGAPIPITAPHGPMGTIGIDGVQGIGIDTITGDTVQPGQNTTVTVTLNDPAGTTPVDQTFTVPSGVIGPVGTAPVVTAIILDDGTNTTIQFQQSIDGAPPVNLGPLITVADGGIQSVLTDATLTGSGILGDVLVVAEPLTASDRTKLTAITDTGSGIIISDVERTALGNATPNPGTGIVPVKGVTGFIDSNIRDNDTQVQIGQLNDNKNLSVMGGLFSNPGTGTSPGNVLAVTQTESTGPWLGTLTRGTGAEITQDSILASSKQDTEAGKSVSTVDDITKTGDVATVTKQDGSTFTIVEGAGDIAINFIQSTTDATLVAIAVDETVIASQPTIYGNIYQRITTPGTFNNANLFGGAAYVLVFDNQVQRDGAALGASSVQPETNKGLSELDTIAKTSGITTFTQQDGTTITIQEERGFIEFVDFVENFQKTVEFGQTVRLITLQRAFTSITPGNVLTIGSIGQTEAFLAALFSTGSQSANFQELTLGESGGGGGHNFRFDGVIRTVGDNPQNTSTNGNTWTLDITHATGFTYSITQAVSSNADYTAVISTDMQSILVTNSTGVIGNTEISINATTNHTVDGTSDTFAPDPLRLTVRAVPIPVLDLRVGYTTATSINSLADLTSITVFSQAEPAEIDITTPSIVGNYIYIITDTRVSIDTITAGGIRSTFTSITVSGFNVLRSPLPYDSNQNIIILLTY